MRPFLLLSIRAEERAALEEEAAFRRFLGVGAEGLERAQLGPEPWVADHVDRWSGILLGGGAFTTTEPAEHKSPEQVQAEADIARLLDDVVAADHPFLGACFGIGTLGGHQGGVVDREHPEPVGPLEVTLTEEGEADPLMAGLPRDFAAYGGHKEALAAVPPGATLLATSRACPVQAFRVGQHVYATQFHPELDLAGVLTRIAVYATYGYFDPSEEAELTARAQAVAVEHPMRILANFAARYTRD
ncbi:glutamine amidotransferase [Nocardioides nanhaiensis]|uniref:Glutamine amidotransferase n=1 Tax=Nocardioides nanhaiensis TaxID=1476871 RepID=A0ABP8WM54_9ACTN